MGREAAEVGMPADSTEPDARENAADDETVKAKAEIAQRTAGDEGYRVDVQADGEIEDISTRSQMARLPGAQLRWHSGRTGRPLNHIVGYARPDSGCP